MGKAALPALWVPCLPSWLQGILFELHGRQDQRPPGANEAPPCHPGERILASGSVQLPRFTLLESGSLLVSPAHLADAGTYTCLATNSRGVDEASADLVVWGKAPANVPVSPSSAHRSAWTLHISVGG